MQNIKFKTSVKNFLYSSNSRDYIPHSDYANSGYTFLDDYDKNVKSVQFTDSEFAKQLGEPLPWVSGYLDFRKNDFESGITLSCFSRYREYTDLQTDQLVDIFISYEDFIDKEVKVFLDGHMTDHSRDGYFSEPLSDNFKYWGFNFQPEVEKFKLVGTS